MMKPCMGGLCKSDAWYSECPVRVRFGRDVHLMWLLRFVLAAINTAESVEFLNSSLKYFHAADVLLGSTEQIGFLVTVLLL